MMQRASVRNGANPSSTSICTRALRSGVSLMSVTNPTGAPATLTFWPGISAAVRSKTASTRSAPSSLESSPAAAHADHDDADPGGHHHHDEQAPHGSGASECSVCSGSHTPSTSK